MLTRNVDRLQKINEKSEKQYDDLRQKVESIERDNIEFKKQNTEFMSERIKFRKEIKLLGTEGNSLKDKIERLENIIYSIRDELVLDNKTLKQKIKKLEDCVYDICERLEIEKVTSKFMSNEIVAMTYPEIDQNYVDEILPVYVK